jgi:uncharacterized protein
LSAAQGKKAAMNFESRQPFLSTRLLHLILMPTEQCNFRCVYCYEDFAAGEMPRPVVEAIKALLARRIAKLDLLSLEWFGGEPLLAWPIIEEIQSFASEMLRDYPEVRLVGSMTTNGSLLTQPRFERLLELGVRSYQISLDGTRDSHDLLRRRLGGGGSFMAIWRNLLAMRNIPGTFDVLLRLHVTRENQQAVDQLLLALARELDGDRRFSVMFKAIRRFGGPNDDRLPVLPPDQEAQVLQRLLVRATELGLSPQQDVFAQPGMLQGCYAAALGSYVVRSTGELAKCTVALAHPNNRIGVLQQDGTVAIDSTKMTGWLRGALNGDPESVECPMKGWADDGSRDETTSQRLIQIGASQANPPRSEMPCDSSVQPAEGTI